MVPQLLEYGRLAKDAALLDRCRSEIAYVRPLRAVKKLTFLYFRT